jgi:hypothetical protein
MPKTSTRMALAIQTAKHSYWINKLETTDRDTIWKTISKKQIHKKPIPPIAGLVQMGTWIPRCANPCVLYHICPDTPSIVLLYELTVHVQQVDSLQGSLVDYTVGDTQSRCKKPPHFKILRLQQYMASKRY